MFIVYNKSYNPQGKAGDTKQMFTKTNLINAWNGIKVFAVQAYKVIRFSVIAIVILTSVVGAYVLTNSDLRNQAIDVAQNQVTTPKE